MKPLLLLVLPFDHNGLTMIHSIITTNRRRRVDKRRASLLLNRNTSGRRDLGTVNMKLTRLTGVVKPIDEVFANVTEV